jgi:exopolysaccharide biosynthesis WecB/TagA/CpsF family protein
VNTIRILGVNIDNLSTVELLKNLNLEGGVVFTPNVDHLIKLQKDQEFRRAYEVANYRVCDSKILIFASQFLGQPFVEKISGSDFFPAFYQYNHNNEKTKIFLLGAAEGVAQKAQARINQKVRRKMVVDTYSPPFGFEQDEQECLKIIDLINQSEATVLAIGLGAPKQEKWVYKYRKKLKKIKIILAVGATIDFEAGQKKRAPKWMSNLGVEWLYRLGCEPRRLWRRYLVEGLPFFGLVLWQKLNLYQDPFASRDVWQQEH